MSRQGNIQLRYFWFFSLYWVQPDQLGPEAPSCEGLFRSHVFFCLSPLLLSYGSLGVSGEVTTNVQLQLEG